MVLRQSKHQMKVKLYVLRFGMSSCVRTFRWLWLKWFNSLFTFVLHAKRAISLSLHVLVVCRISECEASKEWMKLRLQRTQTHTTTTHAHAATTLLPHDYFFFASIRKKDGTSTEKEAIRKKRRKISHKKADRKFSEFISNVAHHRPRIVWMCKSHACNDSLRTMLSPFGHYKMSFNFLEEPHKYVDRSRNQPPSSVLWQNME